MQSLQHQSRIKILLGDSMKESGSSRYSLARFNRAQKWFQRGPLNTSFNVEPLIYDFQI
jgi:hypothetical protein